MDRLSKASILLLYYFLAYPSYAMAQWPTQNFSPYNMGYDQPWYANKWVQHSVALALGALVGAFFSDKFRKYRRIIFLLFIALTVIAISIVSTTGGNFVFFIVGAVVAYNALRDKIARALKKKEKLTTFGSAEWATFDHLRTNKLIGIKGFLLGGFRHGKRYYPLSYAGDRHLLTIAPTRSGKGVSSIVPNLLLYEGSAIVIDPKGENARITAVRRGKGNAALNIPGLNQTVHVVDPWGITGLPSARFNPMDWLKPGDEDINENAMMLADSIVMPHGGSDNAFWDEEAKALLMGLLLYVALDEREEGNRNLGRVREIICMDGDFLKEILLQMVESPNPIISSTAARTMAKEEKLKSNVLASLQSHTHFLDSPRICASLAASDFKFEDLKKSKMTVYLVLPADRLGTFGRWLRLLLQQALTVNARNIEVVPERPILFLLDEMAALGRLTMVEQAFGLMAGFGMQLWGIVQDLSQLERIYDKGWETFIGNSGVLQYFGSRDHKTAEYFSKLCGVETVEKFSFTRSIARAFGYSSSTSSGQGGQGGTTTSETTTQTNSTTEDVVQRHLAYPDELMVMRDQKQLLIIENCNPIRGKKIKWYHTNGIKNLGIEIKKKIEFPLVQDTEEMITEADEKEILPQEK